MIARALLALALAAAAPATAAAQSYLVVVTGLPGTPERRAAFDSVATAIVAAGRSRLGLTDARMLRLSERSSPPATADGISAALTSLAGRAEPSATICLVLLGHGSALGGEPHFNVSGPDFTATQLAALLRRFPTQQLIVVNTTSASGAWIEALAGPRRVVLTATRSASERDETVFARYFAEALGADASDTDKDGRLSVLEAFDAARGAVDRHYQALRRLRTEHAMIDDNGDGRGSLAAAPDADGGRAGLLFFDGSGGAATSDAQLGALFGRRDSLTRSLLALRERRATMDSSGYETSLESVLIDIARNGRAIRQRQAGGR